VALLLWYAYFLFSLTVGGLLMAQAYLVSAAHVDVFVVDLLLPPEL
jgi:hypothetical protein